MQTITFSLNGVSIDMAIRLLQDIKEIHRVHHTAILRTSGPIHIECEEENQDG
ncbi:MAG: hypothetical protein ACXABY_14305 [Candidatus Thorarchaeota archaeon]|jgi:hypothetical protein